MKNLTITAITTLLILANLNAFAEDHKTKKKNFAKEHPRRAEVLNRANNEEKQNNEAAEDGKITKKQAQKLDREDQNIKRQEQRDARKNGGSITKGEQAQLNREENNVNKQRAAMEKRDAANTAAPAAAPAQATTPAGN